MKKEEIIKSLDELTTETLTKYLKNRKSQDAAKERKTEDDKLNSLRDFLDGKLYLKEIAYDTHVTYYKFDGKFSDIKDTWAGLHRLKEICFMTPNLDEEGSDFENVSIHYKIPMGDYTKDRVYFHPNVRENLFEITAEEFEEAEGKYKTIKNILK